MRFYDTAHNQSGTDNGQSVKYCDGDALVKGLVMDEQTPPTPMAQPTPPMTSPYPPPISLPQNTLLTKPLCEVWYVTQHEEPVDMSTPC